MKIEILKCSNCGAYSLNKICSNCKAVCKSPKPAKFSLEDKFGEYRRIYKKNVVEN